MEMQSSYFTRRFDSSNEPSRRRRSRRRFGLRVLREREIEETTVLSKVESATPRFLFLLSLVARRIARRTSGS